MRNLDTLDLNKKFLDVELSCFEFNLELHQNLVKFIKRLRDFYGDVSISIDFEFSSFTDACLKVELYNLPVFFKINQNSLVKIATSTVADDVDVGDFWLHSDGCLVQKTYVDDENLEFIFKKIKEFLHRNFLSLSQTINTYKERELEQMRQDVSRRVDNVLIAAPLISALYTYFTASSEELSLTEIDFLLKLILNTGLAMGFLVCVETLVDKLKNE